VQMFCNASFMSACALPAVNKEIEAIAIEVLTIFNMVNFLGVLVYLQPLLRLVILLKTI
jgi:hypothetical protein